MSQTDTLFRLDGRVAFEQAVTGHLIAQDGGRTANAVMTDEDHNISLRVCYLSFDDIVSHLERNSTDG